MFCPRCGAQVADGIAFCPSCGNPLSGVPGGQRKAAPGPPAPAPRRRSKAPLLAALAAVVAVVAVVGVVAAGVLTDWFGLAGPTWPAGTYLLEDGSDESISLTVEEDGHVSFTQTGPHGEGYYFTGEGTLTVRDGSALIEVDDITGNGTATVPEEMAFIVPMDAAAKQQIWGDWAVYFEYGNTDNASSLTWANVGFDSTITLRTYTRHEDADCEDILEAIHEGHWHDESDPSYDTRGIAMREGDASFNCYDGDGDYVLTASYEEP